MLLITKMLALVGMPDASVSETANINPHKQTD